MSKVRMVFTDVDGTLIGSSGKIPQPVWDAATALRARGIRIAICSGRPAMGTTLDYAKQLQPDGFHVFQNGASIVRISSGESSSQAMEGVTVTRLIGRARRTSQFLELYSDREYVFEGMLRHAEAHTRILGIPLVPRPLTDLKEPVVRAQWIVPHAEASALSEEMARDFTDLEVTESTSPLMPDAHFVMVTLRGVNKASAVASICAREGIPLESAMFVGDGDNDAAPMRQVGFGVAMRNASEKAKEAARYHVGDVEDGAVAEAFALALEL